MGTIKIELYPDKAPKTVENFLQYVKAGHYDGTIFHRVIDGFMIQGGGFTAEFKQKKPTRRRSRTKPSNGLKNDVGTVAMARTGDPNSATAQFFINVADNDFLNFRADPARLRLHGVRQGHQGHGRRQQDRRGRHRRDGPSVRVPRTQDVPKTPVIIKSR